MYTHDALMGDAAAAGYVPETEPPDWFYPDHLSEKPPQEPPTKPAFRFFNGDDLLTPRPVKWLVRGIMEAGVIAGVFGAPASGKSFAGVDFSLCVANIFDWHGHSVDGGAVAYFAGEGQAGLRRRSSAWVQSNPGATANNFHLADRVCHLPTDAADVIQALEGIPNLKMVVLDTLQRTMEGDENSSRDMSAYIQSIDAIKAAFPDLSIVIIHHTGHGSADRARGSSVLKASLDAEILISRDEAGVITMQCTKMKDAEPFALMSFRLESVPLDGWEDDMGQPVTSAVLRHLEGHQPTQQPKRVKVSGKNQLEALAILRALHKHSATNLEDGGYPVNQARVRRFDWQEQCIKERIAEKPGKFLDRIQLPLVNAGAVTLDGEYVLPVDF